MEGCLLRPHQRPSVIHRSQHMYARRDSRWPADSHVVPVLPPCETHSTRATATRCAAWHVSLAAGSRPRRRTPACVSTAWRRVAQTRQSTYFNINLDDLADKAHLTVIEVLLLQAQALHSTSRGDVWLVDCSSLGRWTEDASMASKRAKLHLGAAGTTKSPLHLGCEERCMDTPRITETTLMGTERGVLIDGQ